MTDNRLIFNIFKQLIQLNIKKKNPNNLILKWAEELNKHFPKRKCRWPTGLWKDAQPLSIRKMQIKTIMIYYLTPLRMAIIIIKKKTPTNNKSWQRCGEKGALVHFCCACKVVQLLWKTAWRFIKKLKVELLYDTAVPLLGLYPRKKEKLIRKDTCTPMFIATFITIAKVCKQPKCPLTDEWIKKMLCIYKME